MLQRLLSLLGRAGLAEIPPVRWARSKVSSVTVDLAGVRLRVPKRFVEQYALSAYEPVTQASVEDRLGPGMVVIDVGAHIGYFSLLSAKLVGESGRVHAFEPSDENLSYLKANVALNNRRNVEVYPYAAGAERAQRSFHITGSSDSHGLHPHPNTTTLETVEVTQVPLDEIVTGRVDAVKIDVEGAELSVLDGMARILSENPELTLWVEWMPACMRNAGYDPAELPERLRSLGFAHIEVLDDHGNRRRPVDEVLPLVRSGELPKDWYVNLLARRN
ncbi:MAG TPA: FkbM family methyltransferase [Allosphingosinicella sp.]|nr:FkbM family methyltransferase [Allosphingosinicella sp.]